MKNLIYILVFCLLYVSCKTVKPKRYEGFLNKNLSAETIVEKHRSSDIKTIQAKISVDYKGVKEDINFSMQMKLKKDEVIYLKGSKLITIFKMKLTPNRVQFYSPYTKQYFDGDYSLLYDKLGIVANFNQLQNLFLGQAMNGINNDDNISISEKSYKLTPKKQLDNYDIFYLINPNHFKLDKQYIVTNIGKLDVIYPKYLEQDNKTFPKEINIKVNGKKPSNIYLDFNSIEFNNQFKIPFKIPKNYKPLKV